MLQHRCSQKENQLCYTSLQNNVLGTNLYTIHVLNLNASSGVLKEWPEVWAGENSVKAFFQSCIIRAVKP